jgi:hypothetical protein
MEKKRTKTPMKTHAFAEEALAILIDDYKAGLHPTTHSELARRCGFEGQNVRVFGQVTDLIDGACALADVPSFALVRVRQAKGNVNDKAWRKGRYCDGIASSQERRRVSGPRRISQRLVVRWRFSPHAPSATSV